MVEFLRVRREENIDLHAKVGAYSLNLVDEILLVGLMKILNSSCLATKRVCVASF